MAATILKFSRKRPAVSHIAGPKPKKPHLEVYSSAVEKSDTKSAKRTRPVTRPLIEEDDGDSEGDSDVAEEDLAEDEPSEDGMLVDETLVKNPTCMLSFFNMYIII